MFACLLLIKLLTITDFCLPIIFLSDMCRVDVVSDVKTDKVSISCIDDILDVLKSDYEKEYFVTGTFLNLDPFAFNS